MSADQCDNPQAVNAFFKSLEQKFETTQMNEVVLYGKDFKTDKVYKLVFDQSDLYSSSPGEFKYGSFVVYKNDSRLVGAENIVTGGLFDGYSKYGKIKSSPYLKYLESKISSSKTAQFHYGIDGEFTKFHYLDKENSLEITFYPTQNSIIKADY